MFWGFASEALSPPYEGGDERGGWRVSQLPLNPLLHKEGRLTGKIVMEHQEGL